MTSKYVALIKRELYEHKSVYVVPAAIGIIVVFAALTGQVSLSAFGAAVDVAMVGAAELGDAERRAIMASYLVGLSILFFLSMWILAVFYSLDALYAERKDRSILFWRSLPVTDAETVLSKLVTAVVVIPLITFAGVIVTHLVSLVFTSIWLKVEGGSPVHLLWSALPLFDAWSAILAVLVAVMLWLSPFIGWFLLVSAWTKRSPLLVASMPIVLAPMLERIFFKSTFLWSALFERTGKLPLFGVGAEARLESLFDANEIQFRPEDVRLTDFIDLGQFLSSFSLWAGLAVCGAFTFGAILIRRYRDDS